MNAWPGPGRRREGERVVKGPGRRPADDRVSGRRRQCRAVSDGRRCDDEGMRGFILTGTPGSGKTAVLRQLEVNGHAVVEEAATDVIALGQALGDPRPWERPDFAERILRLQNRRASMVDADSTVFFDRSPVCTLALCRYLKIPAPEDILG